MRIAVIGDLQFRRGEEESIAESLAQVRALAPDYAVAMGDYCVYGEPDRGARWRVCAELLEEMGVRYMPLLGNHDTEFMEGARNELRIGAWYQAAFGRAERDALISADGVHLLCLSLSAQPEEGYLAKNVCMMERAQYDWAARTLDALDGGPVLLFLHAPLAGNGLRQTPMIHAAATDSYVEQNHHPEWARALLRGHPEIVACVSAHFHMGQSYDNAISFARGLWDISCGVITSASRDGSKHSRLLDVTVRGLDVYTIDHQQGGALTLDLHHEGGLLGITQGPERVRGRYTVHPRDCCLIGMDTPVACYQDEGRVYIVTEKGYAWEFDQQEQALYGAISRADGARAVLRAGDHLVFQPRDGLPFAVRRDDPRRLDRLEGLPRNDVPVQDGGRLLPSLSFTARADAAGTWVRW